MNRSTHLLLAIALLVTSMNFGMAGGVVSGGADSYLPTEAFFLSKTPDQKISLCYEVAPTFGITSQEVENSLRWAFETWDQYIESHDLHYALWMGWDPGIIGKLGNVRQRCLGDEDLRVFIGIEHPDVITYRQKFVNPYAFSAATGYGTSGGKWKKGLLWVAGDGEVEPARGIPSWTTPNAKYAFKMLLLHEVGHIFGNGHIGRTIMDQNTGFRIGEMTNPANPFPDFKRNPTIDAGVDLITNLNMPAEYFLVSDYFCDRAAQNCLMEPDSDGLKNIFKKLMGFRPKGSVKGGVWAQLKRSENPKRRIHGRPNEFSPDMIVDLILWDEPRSYKIKFKAITMIAQKFDTAPLFNGQHGNHYQHFGTSILGYLLLPNGAKKKVALNFNMNSRTSLTSVSGSDMGWGLYFSPL